MSFDAKITRTPRPFLAERGTDVLGHVPWAKGNVSQLLEGVGGCSPYLSGLIAREGEWLEGAVDDLDAAVAEVLRGIYDIPLASLKSELRDYKRKIALVTALADLGGVWSLEKVTETLSLFANACVDTTARQLVAAEIDRNKLPGLGPNDAATAGGYVALAMGKMGAGELNYSSDIDLICLFDETRFAPDDYHEARAAFIRVTRRMTAILSETTADGYVFRTDLRLRPDASVTPVCLSMETAERYYESVGRTWERAAYIKAAACAGDVEAGNRFLSAMRPFVWRKHLDFAAIEDAHDMRRRIREHQGFARDLDLNGHNMKLGQGGIRDIEFFTQTRQLIAGGRDETLRSCRTDDGLRALANAGWVAGATTDTLIEHYRAHREIEHRLQMINDAQTHDLPNSPEGFERLAAFCGTSVSELQSELRSRLEEVATLTEPFFDPTKKEKKATSLDGAWGQDVVSGWQRYPAFRSERAINIFKRLWPEISQQLQQAQKPDEALRQFDGFLSGLPAGVQLFSLFEANPQLTELIVDIVATAPALSQYLSRNAGVLDAVLGGSFFSEWPDVDGLVVDLTNALHVDDYEAQLNAARRWAREWHFRIGVHQLRGLIDAKTSGQQYSDLAEAVVRGLWPAVEAEFARKHGAAPGHGAMVLGMGSIGARLLNATSDLDLIVIFDADGIEASDGKRPLATRTYFARLTQALVTALSAPMSDGRLYEVDMRLRPSGRQGPVATSLVSFETYQKEEAWTWEHLALTRARPIVGPQSLQDAVAQIRGDVLALKSDAPAINTDVAEMRSRLAAAKKPEGPWDMRRGKGRLQDLELIAQTLALRSAGLSTDAPPSQFHAQIAYVVASGLLDAADAQAFQACYKQLWEVHAAARLLTGGVMDIEAIGAGGRAFLRRDAGREDLDALIRDLARAAEETGQMIERILDIS